MSSAMYGAPGASQLSPDAAGTNRRNSADPSFLGAANARSGAFSGRRPETNASAVNGQLGERQYPFSKGAHAKSQRPSVSIISVSLAPETNRAQALAFPTESTQTNLSESLGRTLTLEDTTESLNGYVSSGYTNPAGQHFQPNPSSQPWQHQISNGARNFGYGIQQDTWTEPPPASYPRTKRGSLERNSPAGSSYRPHISSPRNLSGTPNPRNDHLPRPVPRNSISLQDFDRQQQGPQYPIQPPGFYQPYFNSQLSQFSTPYDEYTQVQNYRGQIPATGYGGQVNYLGGVTLRTSRDKDPSQGARSQLLEEFRSLNKANRRYELKVSNVAKPLAQ